jgi:autoinducer 2 (AI-2) kinase
MGIREPGETGIVVGWSCPVLQVTAEPRLDAARRTWAGLHVLPGRWVVESSAGDAGRVWRWWCETLLGADDGALEEGAALAAQAPPGAGDVLAFLEHGPMNAGAMGLRLGGVLMYTPLAVGAVDRAHLLRAVLENIAYALRANLEQAEEVSGLPAQRVAVGGGLTRVSIFPRILANVLARPIELAKEAEVSARGAAILAARAVGIDEGLGPVPVERIEPESGAVETYERQYQRWRRLSEALDRTMKELS